MVILEGVAEDLETVNDAALSDRIINAWDVKYGRVHPKPATDGIFRLRPRTACGWSRFPDDATRWRFPRA